MRQTEPSALWNTSMFLSLWVMKVFFLSNEWKMIKLKVNYTELSLLPVTGAAGKWQPTPDSLSFTTLYTCFSAQCLIVGASSWIRASGLRLFIKSWLTINSVQRAESLQINTTPHWGRAIGDYCCMNLVFLEKILQSLSLTPVRIM